MRAITYESKYYITANMYMIQMLKCTSDAGGAERLIVDAACQLAAHGHDVHVFTSHHDRNRCFEETVSGKCLNNICRICC
jgi:hypothetical protein